MGLVGMTAENGDQSDQLVSMLSPGHSNLFGNVVALPTVVVTWFCIVTSRSMLVSRLSQLKAVAVSFIVSCLRRSGQRMHMHVKQFETARLMTNLQRMEFQRNGRG